MEFGGRLGQGSTMKSRFDKMIACITATKYEQERKSNTANKLKTSATKAKTAKALAYKSVVFSPDITRCEGSKKNETVA